MSEQSVRHGALAAIHKLLPIGLAPSKPAAGIGPADEHTGQTMRKQLLWVLGATVIILAVIVVAAPSLTVTMHDAGTDVVVD